MSSSALLHNVVTSLHTFTASRHGFFSFFSFLFAPVQDLRSQLTQRYRDFGHFFSAASSSRRNTMVVGALVKSSARRLFSGIFFFLVVTLVHLTVGNVDKAGSSGERTIAILGEGTKKKRLPDWGAVSGRDRGAEYN
jgi:hypothetical protein